MTSADARSRQRTLADAALELTAARRVDEVLQIVTEAAREVVGAHQGVTSRLAHGWSQATTYVSLSECYAEYRSFDQPPEGRGVLNVVTRENRPLRLGREALVEHPEWRGLRDAPGHPPLPTYLAAPLVGRDGSNLGLIQLSHRYDDADFSAEDEAMLVLLAQMSSNAIEAIELLEREQAARIQAEALQRVGAAIAARLDLQEIVQTATDAAVDLIPARFGAFFYNVADHHGDALMLFTLSGAPREAFERFGLPRHTAIFAPTFSGEAIVRLDDVTADDRYGHNTPLRGMPDGHLPVRSYLAVPVVLADGEVAGGLIFGHPDTGMFRAEDEAMVVGIAAQAAVAIENARLYEERARTASTLQRALLPPSLPEVDGLEIAARYRPAGRHQEVGGDFYDVFELADGTWCVAVGDVCGKGAAAAAVTALARHTLRAHATRVSDVATLTELLDQALKRERTATFCTIALARLARSEHGHTVEIVCAGHPCPVVIAPGAVSAEPLGTTMPPAGILPDFRAHSKTAELRSGAMLVLYTDGVTDAGAPHTVLDDTRVARIARLAAPAGPEAVAEALERAAVEAAGGVPRDDIAVLAVRLL